MSAPTRLKLSAALVDLELLEVRRADEVLPLTELEAALLERLALQPGTPTHRDTLLVEVWGFPKPVATRAVDNTVSRLRQKIEADPNSPEHLRTVRGRGYMLDLVEVLPAPEPNLAPSPPPNSEAPPLPTPPTPFFGREQELDALEAALAEGARLIVLTGLGGSGKTRLVARWMERTQRRLVAALDLSGARDVEDLLRAAARALRLPDGGRAPSVAELTRVLAHSGEGVVVLDNLEQLVEALPDTLAAWIQGAPQLQFVATSRTSTRLSAERRLPLGPMKPGAALALFESRMEAAAARSLGSARERALVAQLLERLGYHALSVELLAARTRALALDRLSERLGLQQLADGPSDVALRHRSLESALMGSWALMPPGTQRAFACTGALAGPFDSELAEVTLGEDELELAALVDASVLRWDADAGLFRMLPPVREFAAARLETLEGAEEVRARVARFLIARAERATAKASGPQPAAHVAQVLADRPHALLLAPQLAEAEPALALGLLLAVSWKNLGTRAPDDGLYVEALEWARRAGDLGLECRVRALLAKWRIVRGDGDGADAALAPVLAEAMEGRGHPAALRTQAFVDRARGRHMRSLAALDSLDQYPQVRPSERADVLLGRGISFTMLDRLEEAEDALVEAITHCEAYRLREHGASAHSNLAVAIWGPPEQDAEAKRLLERALALGDREAHPATTAWRLNSLAWLNMARGELDEARELLTAAERCLRPWSNATFRNQIRGTRSWLASFERDLDAVEALNIASLESYRGYSDPTYVAPLEEAMGGLMARRGRLREARSWYRKVDARLADAQDLPAPLQAGLLLLRGLEDVALAAQSGDKERAEAAVARRRAEAGPFIQTSLYGRLVDRLVTMELARI